MELVEQICNSCNVLKPITAFTRDKYSKKGYTSRCTKCRSEYYIEYYKNNPDKAKLKNDKQRENRRKYYQTKEGKESSRRAHLKRTHGITLEQYNKKLEDQDGKCAICKGTSTHDKHGVLAVDHDHVTGKLRDLLCFKCNTVLGSVNDDKQILINAIKYLEKYEF